MTSSISSQCLMNPTTSEALVLWYHSSWHWPQSSSATWMPLTAFQWTLLGTGSQGVNAKPWKRQPQVQAGVLVPLKVISWSKQVEGTKPCLKLKTRPLQERFQKIRRASVFLQSWSSQACPPPPLSYSSRDQSEAVHFLPWNLPIGGRGGVSLSPSMLHGLSRIYSSKFSGFCGRPRPPALGHPLHSHRGKWSSWCTKLLSGRWWIPTLLKSGCRSRPENTDKHCNLPWPSWAVTVFSPLPFWLGRIDVGRDGDRTIP